MNGEQDVHILMSPRKKNVMSPRKKCTFSCPRGKCASRCVHVMHVMLVQMPARFSLLHMLEESHRLFFLPPIPFLHIFRRTIFFSPLFSLLHMLEDHKKKEMMTRRKIRFCFPTVSPFAAHVASIKKKVDDDKKDDVRWLVSVTSCGQ